MSPAVQCSSFNGASLPFSQDLTSRGSEYSAIRSLYLSSYNCTLAQSAKSLHSGDESEKIALDPKELLELSDSIRASIRLEESVGANASKLSVFLEVIVKDEERRRPRVTFETIQHARLDKLLDELIQFAALLKATSQATELPLRFRVDAAHCKKVRALWRHRFWEQYAMIDQLRCAAMVKEGRLNKVSFTSAVTYDLGLWKTEKTRLIGEVEGNQQFEPGQLVFPQERVQIMADWSQLVVEYCLRPKGWNSR